MSSRHGMSLWIRLVLVLGVFACSGGFTTSHPGGSQNTDQKKSPKLSLAEEAQLLGPKEGKTRWISDELATGQAGKKGRKTYATMQFEPTAGKPSGKAGLGTESHSDRAVSGAICRCTFELVEKDGQRLLKLLGLPILDDAGKLFVPVLYYSIDGDTLTICYPPLPGWPEGVAKTQFRRSK